MKPRLCGRAFPPIYLPYTHHLITLCSFLHSLIACDVIVLNLFPAFPPQSAERCINELLKVERHFHHISCCTHMEKVPWASTFFSLTVELETQSHKDWGRGDVVVQREKWGLHMKMSTHGATSQVLLLSCFFTMQIKVLAAGLVPPFLMLPFHLLWTLEAYYQ